MNDEEVKRSISDSDWWSGVAEILGVNLIGFTERSHAVFGGPMEIGGDVASRLMSVKEENERLRDLAKDLWWARRNLAFGHAGEKALRAEFPWLSDEKDAVNARGTA